MFYFNIYFIIIKNKTYILYIIMFYFNIYFIIIKNKTYILYINYIL